MYYRITCWNRGIELILVRIHGGAGNSTEGRNNAKMLRLLERCFMVADCQ
jgi:hypothetical protein